MKIFICGIIASLIACSLAACDGAIDSQYQEQIVVSAFLYEGHPIDSIILHRTTPFGAYFDDIDYAVDSAVVTVTVDGKAFTLAKGDRKGRYYLPQAQLTIVGGKSYDLSITAPNNQSGGTHRLHCITQVPMPIRFTGISDSVRGRTLVLDTTQEINFQYYLTAGPRAGDGPDLPNRRYMVGVRALDTTIGRISNKQQGPPTDTVARTIYSFVQSGPIVPVSPRLFHWYGANRISFLAIDTNWVDYQRQVAGGVAAYQPSLNHVEGGLGIFGSAAEDTMTVYIKPK